MEFRVLGSLEIWDGDVQVEVTGSKRRAVLAILLLHANEVVGKDGLIEELWGGDPPRNAPASLHNTISRLRKVVGAERLVTRAWGYVLRIEPEQIDLHRFELLVADGEQLPAKERSAKLAAALALWRGPALADLAFEPGLTKEIARLEELRLTVLEARIDADLELGRNAGIIGELEALIAEHPLRERLRAQLILALYRSGRQAEALEVYRETRRLLADELGLEPSPELRELERAILRQDPSLASAAGSSNPIVIGSAQARWRRRRAPLLLVVTALLAAGGVATAVVVTAGGGRHRAAAVTARSTTARSTTVRITVDPVTTLQKSKPAVTHNVATTRAKTRHAVTTASTVRRAPPSKPRARVVPKTHVTTTTSKPVTRHPATKVYWLADDFSASTIDYGLWGLASHGTGVHVVQQNGQAVFSIAADVTYDPNGNVDQHYGTNCYLTGDFDAQVEFDLLNWPAGDGAYVELGAYFPPPNEAFWSINRTGKSVGGYPESYGSRVGSDYGWVQTADLRGALRVSRRRGLLMTSYRYNGAWVVLAENLEPGPAALVIGLSTNPRDFGSQAASVAFENFQATASSVECRGAPLPPKRAHP